MFEVGEGGHTGSEIVEREAAPEGPQVFDEGRGRS